jgi:phenylacetate-CoA ligase
MASAISLYHRLPVVLQNILITGYGYRLRRLRYGRAHEERVQRLLAFDPLPGEVMARVQESRLMDVMRHAASTVPFYRELGLPLPNDPTEAMDALRAWPVLSKPALQAAGRGAWSEAIDERGTTEIHTGGTTGRALAIRVNQDALRWNYAFFERAKRWAGVGENDRVATFAGRAIVPPEQGHPPFWRFNLAARQMLCSSYHLSPSALGAYIHALERFRPRLIDSYPSSIEPIARELLRIGRRDLRPTAILTSSETLSSETRRLVMDAFGCRVFDQYGSAEMVAFVSQCANGSHHAMADFGVLEILDERGRQVAPGEEGEVIATGFLNSAMPLVRYRLGDRAIAGDGVCPCGMGHPTIRGIVGREDEVVVTPDGRRIGRLDPIFKAVTSLHEARIVQMSLDRLRLELVVSEGFLPSEEAELRRQLALRVGSAMRVDVAYVDRIPRTRSGKLRLVESEFARRPSL